MGYIILSPKYIKSKSKENKIENWHLFKAEIYMNDITELYDNFNGISIEEGEVKKDLQVVMIMIILLIKIKNTLYQ